MRAGDSEVGSVMIDTSTPNNSKAYDRALLRAVALSLNPRLQTGVPYPVEAENQSGPGLPHLDLSSGSRRSDDV